MIEKKVPDIRFKEFHDEWESKLFSEVFDITIPNNTLSRANLNYENGEIKNIHYGDILIKFGEITNVKKENIPFVTDLDITKYKGHFLVDGDVIFADTAEDETVGKATEITGIGEEKVVSGLHTIPVRPRNLKSVGYLGYYINSNSYHKQLLTLMQGIKVLSLSKRNLANTSVSYPLLDDEQTKIGELFKNLDNLIGQNQKKYNKLVNMKKACLDKMFPKDGADTPEVRFKGFGGEWRRIKITDVAYVFIGLVTTMTKFYCNEGVLLIRNSDIKDNRFEFSVSPIYLEEAFADANANRKLLFGDVVTVHTGDVGTSAVVTKNETGAIGFATINTRVNQSIIKPNYISTFFNSDLHKNYAIKMSTGDGRSNYNLRDFNELRVPVTTLDEQTKIGDFFESLDHLITLQKNKLGKLKNIKKSCLDKMFI